MTATNVPDDGARRRGWRATAILAPAALVCSADQALPGLLMEPIKVSMGVSDSQIALLTGFSFSVSLAVFALPVSWVADRSNRARLLSLGIICWCLATVGCGFAHGFWSLFLLRMGVGLGEATLKPAGYSLLAELFDAKDLPKPISLLALSSMLGGVLALNGGGLAYDYLAHLSGHGAADAGFAWRATFILFGGVGLMAGLLAWWLPEPRAGRAPPGLARSPGAGPRSMGGLLAFNRQSAFFYAPFILSMCAWTFYNAGYSGWLAPFFMRHYGWTVGKAGQALGLVSLITSLLGLPLGIWFNGVMRRRLGRDAPVAAIGIMLTTAAPFVVLTPFAPNGDWAAVGVAMTVLPAAAATVIAPTIFTEGAPPRLRARMLAISGLFFGVFGSGLGGVCYGAFTDYVLRDPAKLPVTMAVLSGALAVVYLPLLFLADRRFAALKRLVGNWKADS